MENYCFIIQPFDDGGEFDKRYHDVIKPALKTIDLDAYRVDEDPTSAVLITTIEDRIKNSRFCLADITTDNPNVWYEVGYAIASEINIILICSNRRTTPFPFDISHRNILKYNTGSTSDFETLTKNIIKRSKAILANPIKIKPSFNIEMDAGGLTYNEISLIASILSNQDTPEDGVSAWEIKQSMRKSGLNEIAFNIAMRKLLSKKLLEIDHEVDYNGNKYTTYKITEKGNQWVLENEKKFSYDVIEEENLVNNDQDIPF